MKVRVAGSVSALSVLASSSVALTSSGAATRHLSASSSAFCSTLISFETKHPAPPTSINTNAYHAWAKSYLPLYEKLAANAPNAGSKKILNEVVTVLKYEAGAGSLAKLEKYILANKNTWTNAAKALTSAIVSCAGSLG